MLIHFNKLANQGPCRARQSRSRLALVVVALVGSLFLAPARLSAQGFQITAALLEPDGKPRLEFQSDTNSYYVLLRGEAVTDVVSPAALALGRGTNSTLTDPSTINSQPSTRFYRLLKVPLTAPLDSDGDGIHDVYELRHEADLNPVDSTDASKPSPTGRTWLGQFLYETTPLTTIAEGSPANGEGGVAVTRETIFRFNQPLAATNLLTTNNLYATFGGRRILSRIELSSDRRKVTLFYLEPLPASARVRVTFNGDGMLDYLGRPVDLDGDGQPGGNAIVDFDTVTITPVFGTAVIGHVFASEKNPDGSNRPLEHVRITVDGAEEDRDGQPRIEAFTDAAGSFVLTNCPAGRFFVHVDGLTALGSQWPLGAYYPVVGKAWEAVAGRTANLAAGTGVIYLPLVQAGTLQPISETEDTTVGFPPDVIAKNPALAGVFVTIPANALFSDNGARGGRVGLAPVASDRLPEPLPAGIVHALDISIQTDGPQNVDRPLPVRFPNLPDPQTGLKLPPGAKSALMSYNHDTGRWEVQGPMTVSADGNYMESDPGVGVRQPGWHWWFQGAQGGGGPTTGPSTGPGPYDDDLDNDGKPNRSDDNVDGDDTDNKDDPDIDGDGTPNNKDPDMDGDGIPNNEDDDMDGDGIPNDQDDDPDGPDGQCTVSIDGADQGDCGGTLALGSSVSVQGGTYGWSIVGANAELIFPPPGQSGPGAKLNLLSPGQVTVYLTYRPPGANTVDTQCSAQKTITINSGCEKFELRFGPGEGVPAAQFNTFLVGRGQIEPGGHSIDVKAISEPASAITGVTVNWSITPGDQSNTGGGSGTVPPIQSTSPSISFHPDVSESGMRKFCLEVGELTPPCQACSEPQRTEAGSLAKNPSISYTVRAEIVSSTGEFLAVLTETISQDERTILRQEFVDFQISVPPLGEVVARPMGGMNRGNYGYFVRRELDSRLSRIVAAYRGSEVIDANGNPAQFPSLPPGTKVTVPADAEITVTSAFRNPRRNVHFTVGSSCTQTSHHMLSRALDIVPQAVVARVPTSSGIVDVPLELDQHLFTTLRKASETSGNARCERGGGDEISCDAPSVEGGQSIGKHVHVQW